MSDDPHPSCIADSTSFHHRAVYADVPSCRCGQNFTTWLAFDQHLDAVAANPTS